MGSGGGGWSGDDRVEDNEEESGHEDRHEDHDQDVDDLNSEWNTLNTDSFCDRVLSCVKLVVSDLHLSLKVDEIRMFVILRINHEFKEYMRTTYPDTPLSEFKEADTYVCVHGGVDYLEDNEDDE